MRRRLILFTGILWSLTARAEFPALDRLFSRPYLWGTAPEQLKWSRQNRVLVFLWNASGRRFLDLYAYRTDTQRLVRLTDLEAQRDELTASAEEKDLRRSQYPMPPAGIATLFDVARDGSRVAFTYRGDVYLASTADAGIPLRLTRTKAAESAPEFSPDGKRVAYLREGEIYLQEVTTGAISQITDSGSLVREFHWSPDGTMFAYATSAHSRTLLLPNYSGEFVIAPSFPRTVAGDDPAECSLWIVNAAGGKPARMEDSSFGAKVNPGQTLKWSPDSTHLLSVAIEPQLKKLQIQVSDAKTGKTRAIFEDADTRWVFSSTALWSPDGLNILLSSERDGYAHLYVTPREGGKTTQLTRGKWETFPGRFSSDPQWAGGFIYFGSTEGSTAERHFYRIRPDGTGKVQLSNDPGIQRGFVSADGADIAYLKGDQQNPAEVYVRGRRVTKSPLEEFSRVSWPEVRYIEYASRSTGKTVSAKMFLPTGYRPEDRSAKPRPAVFFIHGAGYASSVYKQWGAYLPEAHAFNSYLASKGYVVLDPDYRGSSGYGRDWRTDVYLNLGGPDLEDVLGGVDYLRSLDNIDVSRLGIWGISYGGFMTNTAMFKAPDAFQAGVAWAAVNDWENYSAPYTRQRLTTMKENPEAYRRSSPINFSQNLKNHLLMLHGMADENVLFQDFVQLTEKLIHEGKSVDTFFYPEENHLFVRDESLKDAFRRTAEWFDRFIPL